ncbi:MFS-type transporter SLC18B1 isoform X2 [Dermacentor silvarum]|uniref:MFS-type transporter SLC18B1 isoform X2 n=1 Tax=Dermacentor silvarum TaxID=543639 RepID=UPI002100CFD7|nr:MFS-type transporter SLC18B1 isoform X2 [Dermacentor silvarum]
MQPQSHRCRHFWGSGPPDTRLRPCPSSEELTPSGRPTATSGGTTKAALRCRIAATQADSRGIPAWKYGFFFSTMKLTMLPGAVIAEKLISGVSARAGYLGGQVTTSLFCIICGLLYWIKSGNLLLGVSLLMAAFGGCCNTVYSVCLYTLLTSRFQDDGGMLIGLMECLWGAGTLVGSSIGGALIDLWAFPLPFFVIGGVLLLSLPFMALINPKSSKHDSPTNDRVLQHQGAEKKYWHLIFDFIFIVNLFTVMISWAMTSFNEPTLEPHLRQFKMSSTEVGTVFTVQFIGYSIGALLGGLFAKFKVEPFMNFFGTLLSTIGYIILGPIPIIPIPPNVFFVYISQVFIGVGMAATYVSPYMHALRHAIENAGYPDNEKTHGVVTSATYQFMVFGAVVTSPLAGFVTQRLGFPFSSMIFAGFLAFWTIVTGLVWLHLDYSLFGKQRPPDFQKQPVMEDEDKAQTAPNSS